MTVLVGQGTDDDLSAIDLGATLARSINSDLSVLTVVPAPWPTPVASHTDREFEDWAAESGRHGVQYATEGLAEVASDLTSDATWVSGRSVAGSLLERAEKIGASMIVLASGHDGAYGRIELSSVADRLLHSSPVPVAIAPRGYAASEHSRIARVTAAFRGDEISRRTLNQAAELCARYDVALRIATFAIRGRPMYAAGVGGAEAEEQVMRTWLRQANQAQEEALASLSDAGQLPDQCEREVVAGRSWSAAMDKLAWLPNEVLVIGSSGSATEAFTRLFLGTSASKILRRSPVPAIVVP